MAGRLASGAVVRNRAPRARGGVAEVELLTFVRDVPVGPGSAGAWREAGSAGVRGVPVTLVDAAGAPIAVQVLDRELRHDRVEAPRHYPDVDLVESARCVAWVPPLPGYSARAFALGEGGGDDAARARAGAGARRAGRRRPRGRRRVAPQRPQSP
jgi:hypothetical protein